GTTGAATGQTLLLCWNQDNVGMMGVVADGVDASGWPSWGSAYVLCDSNGNIPQPTGNARFSNGLNGSDVSVAPVGSTSALVAFPILQDGKSAVYLGTYSLAGQQSTAVKTSEGTFSTWNADGFAIVTLDQLNSWQGVMEAAGVQLFDTGNTAS